MTTIKVTDGQDHIFNDAGLQLIGSRSPNSEGLSPRELLEASLALCVSISLQKIMDYDGVDYDRNEILIEVSATKPEDKSNRFSDFKVTVTLPSGLDGAYKEKLKSVTERACTIGNTLRAGAVVELVEV
ncbi:osmotically inducible protein OsmC [Paenibacillus sp. MY03]|jgi:uncharacterized OsmC-like protein|uniref:Osmotically inducible protein OsmC n=1 Tax=Paenibacillus agaridevorans TaxID=171404 RepID=A0A2R5ELD1_9BACL|nr:MULTISPECIES: OsmC family protein [Paenibacillus]OUS68793.1 osmotically inducible protein OsmC [Paenibacillus sp. MY03]QNK58923.1 OsmC family protein [Paenibacillus sp. PAMC21692]GBG05778.1 osmotically inducible protein OsmC [Paenibacillus agaridevorans]